MFFFWRRRVPYLLTLALMLGSWSASAQSLVDINTASEDELQTLPGIGPAKAAAIVAYRDAHDGFSSVEEITAVRGIGDATLERLRDQITIGDAASATREPAEFDQDPAIDLSGDEPNRAPPEGQAATTVTPTTPEPRTAPNVDVSPLININTASAEELDSLPGIGPSKAAAIVAPRTQNGPFQTIDALDDVPGIGPATLRDLRELVTVD